MYESVKSLTIQQLRQVWVSEFLGRIDMEDNWITEGCRFVKWEVKSPRKTDQWAFSITLALAMSGISQTHPQPMAERLAAILNDSAEPGWTFIAENGYVNAYFAPSRLSHYFRGDRSLQVEMIQDVKGGAYALYRLKMIHSALQARNVLPLEEDPHMSEGLVEGFGTLFDLPPDPESGVKWAEFVGKITTEGKLMTLSPEDQRILMTFIERAIPSK